MIGRFLFWFMILFMMVCSEVCRFGVGVVFIRFLLDMWN